ncbi:Thioredoxin superfamily protein [Klebsormidium nitens]|uniref:thioredoxin-dependent peroxiredoxin n=1 Tax=Klebsormidium nitens TaxID=105231 RepID=A0A1Y1IEE6_KLENI|nr:Thioredoxin superfamily protein [Klebsormidium nitens]|eukprot:GAQ86478.1 Thioredoxin superfamily protein [Klebsormidium nitens]
MAPKRKAAAAAKEEAAPTKKGKGGLAIGDDFPNLPELEFDESTPEEKKTVKLSDVLKDHGIILFFYPKANTGGCTKQACGFQDNLSEIEKAGYKVFGMSADKPKSQAGWKAKRGFKYNLLSDPSYEVLKTLGVTKGAKSISRSHIVVEKGGKIKDVRIGISPGDSFAEALKTVTA